MQRGLSFLLPPLVEASPHVNQVPPSQEIFIKFIHDIAVISAGVRILLWIKLSEAERVENIIRLSAHDEDKCADLHPLVPLS